jgi:DNA-binding GntR family transcriptional regulator
VKIEHKTLNERAYEAIRAGLITSQFRPGQVLVIRALADAYGISATPVREALHRLVAERLLTMLPNRSVAVPEFTRDDFAELTVIRVALEGLCAELATPRMGLLHMRRLNSLYDELQAAIKLRNIRTYVALNQQLHFTIYEQAGAPRLLGMIQDLWSQIGPFLNTLFDRGQYVAQANDEHRRIIAALEAGDAEKVRRAVVADIRGAASSLMPSLDGAAATAGKPPLSGFPITARATGRNRARKPAKPMSAQRSRP